MFQWWFWIPMALLAIEDIRCDTRMRPWHHTVPVIGLAGGAITGAREGIEVLSRLYITLSLWVILYGLWHLRYRQLARAGLEHTMEFGGFDVHVVAFMSFFIGPLATLKAFGIAFVAALDYCLLIPQHWRIHYIYGAFIPFLLVGAYFVRL